MAARRLTASTYVVNEHGDVVWFTPDDDVPAWAAKKITNTDLWSDGSPSDSQQDGSGDYVDGDDADQADQADQSDGDDAGQPVDYSKLSKSELEKEIAARNEGRGDDDHIEVEGKGNKPDLIAALQGDDADQADQGDNDA